MLFPYPMSSHSCLLYYRTHCSTHGSCEAANSISSHGTPSAGHQPRLLDDDEGKAEGRTDPSLMAGCAKKDFELIRGGRTPTSMRITLAFPKDQQASFSSNSVESLLLNIQFDGGVLQLITGISMKAFSLDKSVEHMWDEFIPSFCKQHSIAYSLE